MVVSPSLLWLITSMLYMTASFYFHLQYPNVLPFSVKAAYFTFGAGILLAVNTAPGGVPLVNNLVIEYGAVIVLMIAWAFGMQSVRVYVNTTAKYLHKDERK